MSYLINDFNRPNIINRVLYYFQCSSKYRIAIKVKIAQQATSVFPRRNPAETTFVSQKQLRMTCVIKS